MMKKRNRFENFVTYEGNELACAVMYEVACNPDEPLSPMYVFSGTGLGKTHLVDAAAAQMAESGKVSYIIETTAERFRNEYIYALCMHTLPDFYAKFEHTDVLIMENLSHLSGSREIQGVFHEIFDILQEKGKQIILTGDVPLGHLMEFDKSLLSKLMAGYTLEIEAPGFEDRLLILEEEMDSILVDSMLEVDEEELDQILSLIANSETGDIRKMKGMLNRVTAFADLLGEEINLPFAEKVLHT